MRSQYKKSKLLLLLCTVLLLVASAALLTLTASADETVITIALEQLDFDLKTDAASVPYKVYDGSQTVGVTVTPNKDQLGIAAQDDVTVRATASYNSKNADQAQYITVSLSLEGADAAKYRLENETLAPFGAYIAPKELTWKDGGEYALGVTYDPQTTVYDISFDLPELVGLVEGDGTAIPKGSLSLQADGANAITPHTQTVPVDLGSNYTVSPLSVKVTVNPIVIQKILWEDSYLFKLGEEAAGEILLSGEDANGNVYRLGCIYPDAYATAAGEYTVTAAPMSGDFVFADSLTERTAVVTILASEYKVWMDSAVYIANQGFTLNPSDYMLSVSGDLPTAVRKQITYWVEGKTFEGASQAGVYTIVASLPSDLGCVFLDASGNAVTELRATLTLNRLLVNAGDANEPYAVIVTATGGVSPDLTATVTAPQISAEVLSDFGYYKGYKIAVSNSANATYTVRIALTDQMFYAGKAPTLNDLYLYDPVGGSLVQVAQSGKTVTLGEGYYEISDLQGDAEWIFVFAAEKAMTFWLTAPGITLIILLLFAIVILLFFVGLNLIRSRKVIVPARAENKKAVQEEAPAAPQIPAELEEVAQAPVNMPEEPKLPEVSTVQEDAVELEEVEEEAIAFETVEEPGLFPKELEGALNADDFALDFADQAANDLAQAAVEAPVEEAALADDGAVSDAVDLAMQDTMSAFAEASNEADPQESSEEEI